ncbi:hypothetical protein IAT38_001204 [Cryptococcus sp. DSM 104549]
MGLRTKITFWDELLAGGSGVPRNELVQALKSGFNPKLLECTAKGELPGLEEIMGWSVDEQVPRSYRGVYMKVLRAKPDSGKKTLGNVGMSLKHGLRMVWGVGKRELKHRAELKEGTTEQSEYFSKEVLKHREAYADELVMVPLWGLVNHPTTSPAIYVARLAAIVTLGEQVAGMFLRTFTSSQYREGWLRECPTYGQAGWRESCTSIPLREASRCNFRDRKMWEGVTKGLVNEAMVRVGDGFGLDKQCWICDALFIDKRTLHHHVTTHNAYDIPCLCQECAARLYKTKKDLDTHLS